MEKAELHLKQMLKAAENWAKFHLVILHVGIELIIRQKRIPKRCTQAENKKQNKRYVASSGALAKLVLKQ